MSNQKKILFWLNGFLLHYVLSYYLQSQINAEFYGIIDVNSHNKKFFINQDFVKYKKIWFYHDQIKKDYNYNLDFLNSIEKKYDLTLWQYAINERYFYNYNRFYKFSKNQILSILEQEIKLFENILDEIKPDFFLTYDPVLHHQKLLLDMCKKRKIKILSTIIATGLNDKTLIVENGENYDINYDVNHDINSVHVPNRNHTESIGDKYGDKVARYVEQRNTSNVNKIKAISQLILDRNYEDVNSNYMYYGRTKLKVIKDSINLELNKRNNLKFLIKHSEKLPNFKKPYLYFPLSVDEEMNILHYAPFYTNQITLIENIAKSLPINYQLYVKEHIAASSRGWHNPEFYQKILKIPNVVLINPFTNHENLIKNSKLVLTIRGSSSLTALKNKIPVILFGKYPIQVLPSVFSPTSLTELPDLIHKAISHVVEDDFNTYYNILYERLFDFSFYDYEIRRNKYFFVGEINSNVDIKQSTMKKFLDENKKSFNNLVDEHIKIIKKNSL